MKNALKGENPGLEDRMVGWDLIKWGKPGKAGLAPSKEGILRLSRTEQVFDYLLLHLDLFQSLQAWNNNHFVLFLWTLRSEIQAGLDWALTAYRTSKFVLRILSFIFCTMWSHQGVSGKEIHGSPVQNLPCLLSYLFHCLSLSKLQEIVKDREAWFVTVHGVTESDTAKRLNDWTSLAEAGKPLYSAHCKC